MISDPFLVYNFAVDSEYTKFQSVIDEILERAKLALVDFPEQTYDEDFADDTGFTYDSAKAEFSGGKVQQKDQAPAGSIFAGLFDSLDLNWHKAGSVTHTKYGTPVLSGGKVQCFGANGIYYGYTTQAIEVYKVKYSPNYNSVPAGANADVVNSCNGVDTKDKVVVYHGQAGDYFRITVYNNTGALIFSGLFSGAGIGAASGFTTTSTHELLIEVNSTAGTLKLWIGGTLIFTASPGAWERGGIASRLYLGANPAGNNNAEASYDDIVPFNTVQQTGNYTPGYTLPSTIYAENKVDLPAAAYPYIGALQLYTGFEATVTGAVRWILNGKYPVGGIWQTSNGSYAQAVSDALVDTYIGNLGVQATTLVSLVFQAGNVQQSVDFSSVEYTGQQYAAYGRVKPNAYAVASEVEESTVEFASQPEGTDCLLIYDVNGQLKFYDETASAWADSDGTPDQANSFAVSNANAAALLNGGGNAVYPVYVLTTTNQQVTPELETAEFGFLHGAYDPDGGTLVKVFAVLKTPEKVPIEGAKIQIVIKQPAMQYQEAGGQIISDLALEPRATDPAGTVVWFLLRSSDYEASGVEYWVKSVVDANGRGLMNKNANNPITFPIPDGISELNITAQITGALASL